MTHCYQTIHQIAKLKGGEFVSDGSWVSILYALGRSPNPMIKTLILCETHVMQCSSIKATKVRSQYGLVNT